MLELPPYAWSQETELVFQSALCERNASKLPAQVPRWLFLQWLVGQGYVLHGSNRADVQRFEPRTPVDLSPDDFSKRTAVFAASDGIWAMMYALVDRARIKRMLNMALQVYEADAWSPMQYFLSLAPRDATVTQSSDLLCDGTVYVLPTTEFEAMPPYFWPDLGDVREPQQANPYTVLPVMQVPVSPSDFPFPVRLHDAQRVDALCQSDPWNFPWLLPDNSADT